MLDLEFQRKADKIVDSLKMRIEASVIEASASVPGFEITKYSAKEFHIPFVRLHTANTINQTSFESQTSFEADNFDVEINRILFRAEKETHRIKAFDLKELRYFIEKTSYAIPAKLIDELTTFKETLPLGEVVKLHLLLPEEVSEIYAYEDHLKMRHIFDMAIYFGAWAEVDGNIFTYKYNPDGCEPSLFLTSEVKTKAKAEEDAKTDIAIGELVEAFLGRM